MKCNLDSESFYLKSEQFVLFLQCWIPKDVRIKGSLCNSSGEIQSENLSIFNIDEVIIQTQEYVLNKQAGKYGPRRLFEG